MSGIFISYRRDDAQGEAGHLLSDLRRHFGKDRVFMDVVAIRPGEDFRKVIDNAVASCDALLVLIGKNWVDSSDESGQRRLEDPKDFVRLETSAALRRDVPVIPVLVQGAVMPKERELPEDLQPLIWRNAIELSHNRWSYDVGQLIHTLELASKPGEKSAPEISYDNMKGSTGTHHRRDFDVPPLDKTLVDRQPSTEDAAVDPNGAPSETPKQSLRLLGILLLALLLTGGTVTAWVFWPREIPVPDLTGMSRDRAADLLENTGLSLGKIAQEESATSAPGTVLRQTPAPGEPVYASGTVDLVVAAKPRIDAPAAETKTLTTVPSVVGMTLIQARATLGKSGLALGTVREERSRRPPGTVLKQFPHPRENVPRDQSIELLVAGKSSFTMPDVVGKRANEAKNMLIEELGLYVEVSAEAYTVGAAIGTVVRQSPAPGATVNLDQAVKIFLAGKPGALVPNVVGYPIKEAQALLEKNGLGLGAVEEVPVKAKAGYVLKQALPPGEVVYAGRKVDLAIGKPALKTPVAVRLLYPRPGDLMDNGCTNRSGGVEWQFAWAGIRGASRYHLYVAGPAAKKPVVNDETLTSPNYRYYRAGSLIADQSSKGWFWRVRAEVDGVWTDWSDQAYFDVEPVDTDCRRKRDDAVDYTPRSAR